MRTIYGRIIYYLSNYLYKQLYGLTRTSAFGQICSLRSPVSLRPNSSVLAHADGKLRPMANFQACRGYEIIHPYPYPYPQIFRGYPWIIHIHRCPSSTGLHVGLCTEYPQSTDDFYYSILTITTSISIPYLVSK